MCDKRRDIAFAEEQFPGVDFSHIERGADVVYDQHKVESEHAVMERGARFLQWLMARWGPLTNYWSPAWLLRDDFVHSNKVM